MPSTSLPDDLRFAAHPYRPAARFAAAVAAGVVGLAVLWLAWSVVARHRLRREIDVLAARGEPFTPGDFPNPRLADADNAAVGWRAAAAAVSTAVDCPSASDLEFHVYPTYPPEWWTAVRASEAANGPVFQLAHAAASRHRAAWSAGTTTLIDWPLPDVPYNELRNVANVLADSALLAHFGTGAEHDDGRCLDRIGDVLRLAEAIDQQPSMISRLVAIGVRELAESRLLVVAPHLDVGPPGSARRQQARALIAQLLADPPTADRAAPVMAERATQLQTLADQRVAYRMMAPQIDLSAARFLRQFAVDVAAAQAPDAAAATAVYAAHPSPPVSSPGVVAAAVLEPPSQVSRCFDGFSSMAMSRFTDVDWRSRAQSHATAAALAVRLFRVDHDGRWPADLSVLVPDDLPAVATDPTAARSPPVGYFVRPHGRPDGGDRPIVFIRHHGVDPATFALPARPLLGFGSDDWIDLTRWDEPPLPQPPMSPPPSIMPPGM